jgi:hypothetical protein
MKSVSKWLLFKKSFKLRNLIQIHSSEELLLLEHRQSDSLTVISQHWNLASCSDQNVGRKREDTKSIQKFSSKISLEMPTRKNKEMGGQLHDGSFGQPPHYNN